jgi:quercetin dioxygenase-like cupin family protein
MVQMGDAELTELKTGASLYFPREVAHGGAKVVGETPLRLLTVHIVDKGKPLSQPVP